MALLPKKVLLQATRGKDQACLGLVLHVVVKQPAWNSPAGTCSCRQQQAGTVSWLC